MTALTATKTAKATKKAPANHPPYFDMIKQAVKELKERNGSSRQAIAKYVKSHFKVDDRADSHLKQALVRAVKAGKLNHTKGAGASGSFKLAEKVAAKPKVAKKPRTPKKAAAKKTKTAKPTSAKKPKAAAKPKTVKPKKVKTPKKAKTMKPKKPVAKKTPKKAVKKTK